MTVKNRCLLCLGPPESRLSWHTLLNPWAETTALCAACAASLDRIQRIACRQCGRRSDGAASYPNRWPDAEGTPDVAELCQDCRAWREEQGSGVVTNRSLFTYNALMKDVVATYKYRGDAALAGLFVSGVKKLAASSNADLYTVIPLAEDRLFERGFNQAALLAGDLPLTSLITRSGKTVGKQSKRGKEARREELVGVFALEEKRPDLSGKTVCIIDDLYTTGSTLYSASSLLYQAGAERVVSVTAVRA